MKFVGTPHKEIYDERITFDRVQVDGDLANVWTSYKFYVRDKFSHCGVNSMTLVKEEGAWKVLHIIDTRRKIRYGIAKCDTIKAGIRRGFTLRIY